MILDSGEENCHRISVWDLKGLTTYPQQCVAQKVELLNAQ